MAAALSGYTRTMELMVAVHPGINTPQMVAKMGASLDRISGGRLSLNVVNGWNVDEFNIFGNGAWLTELPDRYQRMDEYIEVIKRLWTEDSFDFDGKFYRFKGGKPLEFVPREPPFGAGSDPSNITDACYPYGSIQVPGGTEPIVLHRDAVSGGGYFMVGTVISADMDLIGQLQPNTPVRFVKVEMDQALAARKVRAELLAQIRSSLKSPP